MRFQYSLQPVLLTRQWDLDALLLDLNRVNSRLSLCKSELAKLRQNMQIAGNDWKMQTDTARGLTVGRFVVVTHYLGDLAKQCLIKEKTINELEDERDVLISRVAGSKRGVEAVEKHRDEMRAEFIKEKMSDDFKFADDQWSTLQASKINHDKQS